MAAADVSARGGQLMIGLAAATCFPWPFPNDTDLAAKLQDPIVKGVMIEPKNWAFDVRPSELPRGLYPWPVWGPVPHWLWEHRWALGLVTGLAGAAAGMALLRLVKFTFEKGLGKEALGMGDVDARMVVSEPAQDHEVVAVLVAEPQVGVSNLP